MIYILLSLVLCMMLNVQCADVDHAWDAQGVKDFFERSSVVKAMEYLEYTHSPEHIVLFVTRDRLEAKLYGTDICGKAKLFVAEMQKQLATKLAQVNPQHKKDMSHALWGTSRHARYICNVCCALQLKVIAQEPLGTLDAKYVFYLIWPWTKVCAQKFYDTCCTDFYRNKSEAELKELFEATK